MIFEVLNKKEMQLQDKTKLTRVDGFVSSADIEKQLAIAYTSSPVEVGRKYACTMSSTDMKTFKIKLQGVIEK